MEKQGYVYILTNKTRNVLYCGVTSDLYRRVCEHKSKLYPGFTQKDNVNELVYFEVYSQIVDAIQRETKIKKLRRKEKMALIDAMNSGWVDYFELWNRRPTRPAI